MDGSEPDREVELLPPPLLLGWTVMAAAMAAVVDGKLEDDDEDFDWWLLWSLDRSRSQKRWNLDRGLGLLLLLVPDAVSGGSVALLDAADCPMLEVGGSGVLRLRQKDNAFQGSVLFFFHKLRRLTGP